MVEAKVTITGTEEGGILRVKVDDAAKVMVKQWLTEQNKHYGRSYDMTLKVHRKKRTQEQNALYWSLVRILAYEVYGMFGFEELIHEELLRMYAPRVRGKLSNSDVPKRSKHLNTVEFAALVEGTFRELAVNGVSVDSATQIGSYWKEWMTWRGTQGADPRTYSDIKEWMNLQVFCEACLKYIGPDRGTAAHIMSRGSGGVNEVYNLMRLCDECHIHRQHQKGWQHLIDMYPHIGWRVKVAYEKQGSQVEELDIF